MKSIFTTIVLLIFIVPAFAQKTDITANEDILVVTTPSAMPKNILQAFSGGRTNMKGKKYLEEQHLEGVVTLTGSNKAYHFRQLRYNIFSHDLEVQLEGKTKFIRNMRVASFSLKQGGKIRKFISARPYMLSGERQNGYLEVLADGEVKLVKQVKAEVLSSNYNIALNVGDRSDKITQKEKMFLAKNDKLYSAKSKRRVRKLMTNARFNAKVVIKEKSLKIKRLADLKILVDLYNTQVSK